MDECERKQINRVLFSSERHCHHQQHVLSNHRRRCCRWHSITATKSHTLRYRHRIINQSIQRYCISLTLGLNVNLSHIRATGGEEAKQCRTGTTSVQLFYHFAFVYPELMMSWIIERYPVPMINMPIFKCDFMRSYCKSPPHIGAGI